VSRVLVTGALGFIGSHLTRRLLADGHEVYALDSYSVGRPRPSTADIEKGATLLHRHLEDNAPLPNVEIVYHLAAAINTKAIDHDPLDVLLKNVELAQKIVTEYRYSDTRVFFASTVEVVNGIPRKTPTTEKSVVAFQNWYDQRWSYAISKAYCELILRAGLEDRLTIARFSNVYGEDMCHNYVVKALIQRLQKGENPLKVAYPDDTRCFQYVGDVVDAVVRLMESEETTGDTYQVSGEEVSVGDLADLIAKHFATPTLHRIEDIPAETRNADISKIRRAIGWEPQTTLDDGIGRTIDWYRREYSEFGNG